MKFALFVGLMMMVQGTTTATNTIRGLTTAKLGECQYDCDVDADCEPGLLCADAHKAELKKAGYDERKAYCSPMDVPGKGFNTKRRRFKEVCYDPKKIAPVPAPVKVAPTSAPITASARITAAPTSAPITATPTSGPVQPLPDEDQDELVTCVSVIDENDNAAVDAAWIEFRKRYPDRPFCLLRPVPSFLGIRLGLPTMFSNDPTKNIFAEVTRDAQDSDPATQSDWFSLCNLSRSRRLGLTNVVLFVDNSGSMYTRDVQNAHDAFQLAVVANGMNVVEAVYNDDEDYINPCFATSLGGN